MSFQFRPAKRENVPLLVGLAGGTGSGKTYSALELARGIAGGGPFAGIDTENGRMNHYADLYPELLVADITAPFRPQKYADAIDAAVKHLAGLGVPPERRAVVVDSMSHEWYGDGGCLDWQEELMEGKESKRLASWIEPKKGHKRMVTRLLQVDAHVILCFRAEPKVEAKKVDGRLQIVPKESVTGLDGWLPISEKNLPYELTASFLLMAERPGVPKKIKLQEQHLPLVPLDRPLTPEVGAHLAAWAAGGTLAEPGVAGEAKGVGRIPPDAPVGRDAERDGPTLPLDPVDVPGSASVPFDPDTATTDEIADEIVRLLGPNARSAITRNRNGHAHEPEVHLAWLRGQYDRTVEASSRSAA